MQDLQGLWAFGLCMTDFSRDYPLLPLDRVTHCICAGMTPLETLSGDLRTVMDQTGCGTFCKICLPYLAQRLAAKSAKPSFSGETDGFSV